MRFLAIDIGSSFIKTAGIDLSTLRISDIERCPTPVLHSDDVKTHELRLYVLLDHLREIIERYDRKYPLSGIVLCVQMHGLLAYGNKGEFTGNYITWQDMRAEDYVRIVRDQLSSTLFRRLGNSLDAQHTAVQLYALCARNTGKPSRIALLGDAITEELSGYPAAIHETNACSTGLYDVYNRCWSQDAIQALGFGDIIFPAVTHGYANTGSYCYCGKQIPIYPTIGDQQAAILGCIPGNGIMLNVATGGQLIGIGQLADSPDSNVRPLFDGRRYVTAYRLPAGRSIQQLMNLFADASKNICDQSIDENTWERFIAAANGIQCDGLHVKLNDGIINGIDQNNLNCAALLRGAFIHLADQYHQAYLKLKKDVNTGNNPETITFAGGLLRKTTLLQKLVQERFGLPYRISNHSEDTLAGLARYALVCGGYYASIDQTAEFINRISIDATPTV